MGALSPSHHCTRPPAVLPAPWARRAALTGGAQRRHTKSSLSVGILNKVIVIKLFSSANARSHTPQEHQGGRPGPQGDWVETQSPGQRCQQPSAQRTVGEEFYILLV